MLTLLLHFKILPNPVENNVCSNKKQAKTYVSEKAKELNMPYVTERWLGGMLTNFSTIRKSLKKLSALENLQNQDTYTTDFSKKKRLMMSRDKDKLDRALGGISL